MNLLKKCQSGIITIIAIVALGLFAVIGVYMSTQFNTTAINTATSYLGIQGWFAARSGADWATHQALHAASCPASTGLTVTGYSVTVTCNPTAVSEGPDNYVVYDISSRAAKGSPGDVGFVSRIVNISVTDAP